MLDLSYSSFREHSSISSLELVDDPWFENAIMMSLFSNQRDDSYPLFERQGWWADEISTPDGKVPIGSRIWTLLRMGQSQDILPLISQYATDSLNWMKDDKLIKTCKVLTSFEHGSISIAVVISLAGNKTRQFNYKIGGR